MTGHSSPPIRIVAFFLILAATATARAGVDDLRITEVDPLTGSVEVTHLADEALTTTSSLPFCHRLDYSTSIPSGTMFGPGESKVFTVVGLSATDSDLWLYRDGNFDRALSILSGLKYGPAANVGRTSLAASVGLWPSANAFVPAPTAGESLRLMRMDPTRPEHWEAGPQTPGAFFGTGEPIDDPIAETIPKGDVTIELQLVVGGLTAPIGTAVPDDGTDRMFVYDQAGTVVLLQDGARQPGFFMDVRARLVPLGVFGPGSFDERGLLGFALHPDFARNPLVYTYTSEPIGDPADFTTAAPTPAGRVFNHQSVVAEWTVDQDTGRVDPTSRREILRIDEPQFNHNAGTLRFGPDGHLYIAVGDGGGGDDEDDTEFFEEPLFGHGPGGNGRNLGTVHGTLLRIDVDARTSANGAYGVPADNPHVGAPGLDEIWAHGLRNPFAFSFDRATGALWLGDVGQNDIEEIDVVEKGDDLGWRLKEGSFFFQPGGQDAGTVTGIPGILPPANLKDPVAEYDHDDGFAVIGGFVYRGAAVAALAGRYVTGDFGGFGEPSGRLFWLDGNDRLREFRIGTGDRALGLWLKGFGQDRDGELHVLGSTELGPFGTTGAVFRIVPVDGGPSPADPPTLKKMRPASFRAGETVDVTIKGKNLTGVLGVSIGDGVTILGIEEDEKGKKLRVSCRLDCEVPLGSRDVTVTTAAGAATREGAATIRAPKSPKAKKLTVREGAPGQSLVAVVLRGKRFRDCDLTVAFSDPALEARNIVVSGDGASLTFDLAIGVGAVPGKVDLTVTIDGLSHTKRKAFRVRE